MAWFKVDDKLHGSPKAQAAGKAAMGVWALVGSWCMDQLTDGHVTGAALRSVGGTAGDAKKLIAAGFWHGRGHDCERCPQPREGYDWIFHDWLDRNPSAESVKADREAVKKRVAEFRERKKKTPRNRPEPVEPEDDAWAV